MTAASTLPGVLRALPVAVLVLSPDGRVLASNGKLEAALGREVVDRPFGELVDARSSAEKWERILAGAGPDAGPDAETDPPSVWELILEDAEGAPTEPRAFSVLRGGETDGFWLVEHRVDPRLEALGREMAETNSELANAQRALLKERGRLAHALQALEARSAELERSNRALDEFAAVTSHDLKAPLRSIAMYAEWAIKDAAGELGPESRSHLARIRSRVERMHAMVEGALAYARAGREHVAEEDVDVAALVMDVAEILDAESVIAADPRLPVLVTERPPLQQVLLNLLSNAVRYADPEEPRVRVEAERGAEGWTFGVVDNGPGIPARLQDRIWTLFHTLEPEEEGGGTGIGLAVVKRLVEGQGGRVWIESEEGSGAAFRFTWPVRETKKETMP